MADIDQPGSDEERRGASALARALEATAGAPPSQSSQRRWLAAHLRQPTVEDSLGDVRAWRLARGARAELQARRLRAAQRSGGWTRLGRLLTSTGGLLASASVLLLLSWLLLGRGGSRPPSVSRYSDEEREAPRAHWLSPEPTRAVRALLFRRSIRAHESATQRLDLMIQARLAELRSGAPEPERLVGSRGLASSASSMPSGGQP